MIMSMFLNRVVNFVANFCFKLQPQDAGLLESLLLVPGVVRGAD
jgi:hypothetical protein